MKMKLFKNRQSGQVLIMALILLAVGSLLVIPLLRQSFTNLGYHQSIECQTLNSYSADAGLVYATAKIYGDSGTYTETPLEESFELNGRTVNVTAIYQGGGVFSVNSTASGGGCGRTRIRAIVNISHGAFAFALAAKDSLGIYNSVVDSFPDSGDGDIHSNNTIDIAGPKKGQTAVNGDATAVGTISGQEYVNGEVFPYSANLTFPITNAELYETIAKEGGTHNGDLQYSGGGTHNVGPLYITGNLIVDAWTVVVLEGPLYVLGYVQVNNGHIEGYEHIICEGEVQIFGGGYGSEAIPVITSLYSDITLQGPVVDAVLYAPNGTVALTNLELFGAAGGFQVLVDNSYIWYSEKLHGRADLPGSELYPLTYSYD